MEHDIKGLILEQFNKEYPWLLDKQKRRGTLIASKPMEDIHCIQIGEVYLPAHIPEWAGIDVECRGRAVFKDAFICASMCLAILSLIHEIDSGDCVIISFDYKDKLNDLYQLIADYYECLTDAKWVNSTIENY